MVSSLFFLSVHREPFRYRNLSGALGRNTTCKPLTMSSVFVKMALMRKMLCVLTLAAVLCLGIMGSLSVIPHAHGKDDDHATHSSCPICQFTIQGFSATAVTFSEVITLSIVLFCLVNRSTFCDKFSYQLIPARGPPVLI